LKWPSWAPSKALPQWQSLLLGLGLGVVGGAASMVLPPQMGRDGLFVTVVAFVALAAALGGVTGGAASLVVATIVAVTFRDDAGPAFFWPLAAFWVTGAFVIGLLSARGNTIRDLRSNETRLVSAKAQLQTIAGELAHRNRNSLFVIMSIVSQSAQNAPSASEAARIINGRLEALLRAQDLLARSESGAIGLKALLDEALRPFGPERFDIAASGEVFMATDIGIGLGLLFHELATNAVKHGALSSPAGRVFIEWRTSDETAYLTWRETGGPPVSPPAGRGFGSRLFEVALVPQGGKAERRFEATGLVCELTIPAPSNPPPFLSSLPPGSAFAQGEEDTILSA
jgi:two-component sensor histidine kinase